MTLTDSEAASQMNGKQRSLSAMVIVMVIVMS